MLFYKIMWYAGDEKKSGLVKYVVYVGCMIMEIEMDLKFYQRTFRRQITSWYWGTVFESKLLSWINC